MTNTLRCSQQQWDQAPRAPKFKGRCDNLTGHIYNYANPRQAADQFTKTTRKICEYVGRMYKYSADAKTALETMAEPTFTEPMDPDATVTWTQQCIWEKQVDEHVKRCNMLTENLKTAHSLIYGQCSNALRAKLELRPYHLAIEGAADSIRLLENIRTVVFQFQSQRYSPLALHKAKRRFYLFSHDWHMTCQQYHETFKNNVGVIKYCGGVMSKNTELVDSELTLTGLTHANATEGQLQGAETMVRERVLACAFLLRSDHGQYGKLLEDLENDFTQGTDNFPPTLQQAYTLLVHWKQDPRNVVRLMGGVNDSVPFANVGAKARRTPEWGDRQHGRTA